MLEQEDIFKIEKKKCIFYKETKIRMVADFYQTMHARGHDARRVAHTYGVSDDSGPNISLIGAVDRPHAVAFVPEVPGMDYGFAAEMSNKATYIALFPTQTYRIGD